MHTDSQRESRLADFLTVAQDTSSSLSTIEEDLSVALLGVQRLARLMGISDEETLEETPYRVVKAWLEMVHPDPTPPSEFLKIVAMVPGSGLLLPVTMENIWFTSVCEHHLLPFSGYASVSYEPNNNTRALVGLSKLARLVDYFAKAPQVQERLTQMICTSLQHEGELKPNGVTVVVQASHACVGCRGIKRPRTPVTTMAASGSMEYDVDTRVRLIQNLGKLM